MCNNDIKIDDLVLYKSKPVRVLELNTNSCTVEQIELDQIETNVSYEEIEPIPLTSELLKNIGWRLGFDTYWTSPDSNLKLYWDDKVYQVWYDINTDIAFDALAPIADIKYLHELQHLIWVLEGYDC